MTNAERPELAACPFCGGERIAKGACYLHGGLWYREVTCRGCNCRGPTCGTAEEAARLWNTRAADRRGKTTKITEDQELDILCRRLANLYKKPDDYPPACACVGLDCGRIYCNLWWHMLLTQMDADAFAKMVHLYLFAKDL